MTDFRGGRRGSEKLSNLLKVTQLEDSEFHARQDACVTMCLSWSRDSCISFHFMLLTSLFFKKKKNLRKLNQKGY